MMHAVNYSNHGDTDVLQLSDVPVPEVADDEVLIRVHAASLNAFDWKLRTGLLADVFDVGFPITPGRDGCGEVVLQGEKTARGGDAALQPGERVSFISSHLQHGALAEFAAVNAGYVVPAPSNMTDQQCAALPLVGLSAWTALVDTAELQSGMKVLIHGGSGGVGSIAIQLARHIGAEVHATCRDANVDRVEALGATAIPYDRMDFTEAVEACDVVLDTVGGEVHEKSYRVLRPGGRLVYLIAKPFRDVSSDFDVDTRQATIMNRPQNLARVMELAASGVLRPAVSARKPMTEFREAFRLLESGNAGGKIVLTLSTLRGANHVP